MVPSRNSVPREPNRRLPAACGALLRLARDYKLLGLAVVLAVVVLPVIHSGVGLFQWDFEIYYYSSRAFALSWNPYDHALAESLAGRPLHPFMYAPWTLLLFAPFTALSLAHAKAAYLAFKAAALSALVILWVRRFARDADQYFFAFLVLGYNLALSRDVFSGNVSVFEELFLWAAFSLLLAGRHGWFTVMLLLSSMFKPWNFLFIILLGIRGGDVLRRHLAYPLAAYGAYYLSILLLPARIVSDYLSGVFAEPGMAFNRGALNPSTYPLIRDICAVLSSGGFMLPPYLPGLLYLACACAVAAAAYAGYGRLKGYRGQDRDMITIFLAVMSFALVCPRFKDYSYLLLIVPTYYVLRMQPYSKAYPLSLLPMYFVLPLYDVRLDSPLFLLEYLPLFTAYCVWGLYMLWIFRWSGADAGKSRG